MSNSAEQPLQVLTQKRVDEVIHSFEANASIPKIEDPAKFDETETPIIRETLVQINGEGGNPIVTQTYKGTQLNQEQAIYLASTSKVPWAYALSLALEDKSILVSNDVLVELVGTLDKPGRERSRIIDHPEKYTNLWTAMKEVFPDKSDKNLIDTFSIAKGISQTTTAQKERMLDLISKLPKNFKFELELDELRYHSLGLSSNAATTAIKAALTQRLGSDEKVLEHMKNIIPGFNPNYLTIEGGHWIIDNANTGQLSSIAQKQHELVVKNIDSDLLKHILNNQQSFNHDFTHSSFGIKLKQEGWQIIEKTGFYGAVNWTKDQAINKDCPMPNFATYSTVVTVVHPKTKETLTIAFCRDYEMPLPVKNVKEPSGLVFPDTESESYSKMIERHYEYCAKLFRGEVERQFEELFKLLEH